MAVKIVIKWLTKDETAVDRIRKRFNIPYYTTFNGYSPGYLKPEDRELFEECARCGFLTYTEKEWTFNGLSCSW